MSHGRYGKMTVKEAIEILKEHSLVIKKTDYGDFRVNFKGGKEATAYYTNDLMDAVNTGVSMSRAASNRAYHKGRQD